MTTQARKQRRAYLRAQGFLKMKRELPINKWMALVRETQKRGSEIHQNHVENQERLLLEQLEIKEINLVKTWKNIGYNDKEIEKLKEANASLTFKDRGSWKEDKKIARKQMKEAQASMLSRITR